MYQTSYPTNPHHSTAFDQEPAATGVQTVVVHHPTHTVIANETRVSTAGPGADEECQKRPCLRAWLTILSIIGSVAIVLIPVLILRSASSSEVQQVEASIPSPAPTALGDEECGKKRIKITEICNASGLDDELVELKVLVNDQHYWPKQVESDCLEGYGSYGYDRNTCLVPNSSLDGSCFTLRNSIELLFGGDDTIDEQIKVTLHDTDFFWDDIIEIFAPKRDWYLPNLCEKREFEFAEQLYDGSAKIKMVVDFGEVQNPCGVEEDALLSGLNDAATALENVQLGLLEYARGAEVGQKYRHLQRQRQATTQRRRLIFSLLATGFRVMAGAVSTGGRSFIKLFTRQTRVGNALSTTADMATIGSILLGSPNSYNNNNNEALLEKVFDRFDQIDNQLDNIQAQIKDGFEEIKLAIEEEFAEQKLDEWITFRLGVKLREEYLGYTDRSHTGSSRVSHEETFRQTCNGDHSPYNIFQVLYSYSCLDCQRFSSGKAQQYFLDTYVNLASANFETPVERVLWFRRSFGTVIIGALTEAIYFYSVCLYGTKDDGQCGVADPVWDTRLAEMGDALEEVVTSLGEAETRLE
mmetsp:Transcript_26030/g.42285  ORF Transcript_26030/g.42285 Transcript_26030/m.42285 type:complete len:582 (-) Transcript_26030:416-2161(-)